MNPEPIKTGAILVVDDEPQIHRFLTPALTAAGYHPLRADSAADALRLAATASPDLILLDLGLPDIDGQVVLTRLREFCATPVIILSARDRESEKIAALDAGADDYVEKPFALGELLARIRAHLRQTPSTTPQPTLIAGGLILDPQRRAATITQQGITTDLSLTRIQYGLLALFLLNQGRVLTHHQILSTVWGPAHTEDIAYLRIYVSQLRRKLISSSCKILTEPGVGYRMIEDQNES